MSATPSKIDQSFLFLRIVWRTFKQLSLKFEVIWIMSSGGRGSELQKQTKHVKNHVFQVFLLPKNNPVTFARYYDLLFIKFISSHLHLLL